MGCLCFDKVFWLGRVGLDWVRFITFRWTQVLAMSEMNILYLSVITGVALVAGYIALAFYSTVCVY